MQRLALERHRTAVPAIFAVDLEYAQINAVSTARRRVPGCRLALSHFTHTLATVIVDVVGRFRSSSVCYYLLSRRLELVSVVPLHQWQVGHSEHITMNVIGIPLHRAVARLC